MTLPGVLKLALNTLSNEIYKFTMERRNDAPGVFYFR